ncbi:MAG: thiamine-phosphate kinase [Gammaproteobacteria bacterium]|nr:thiamine-phosphate kinase [Gammaproteobacteria bacterium]
MSTEQRLIDKYFRRDNSPDDVVAGIGDDAAVLRPAPGNELVAAVDTLAEAVHFPRGLASRFVGWRALAVNLSDLAAMGAEPSWALLSLSVPAADESWFSGFASGFFRLAEEYDVALVGGDTVRGPLSISVTVLGQVPAGVALTRSGARPGDRLFVSGNPGAAALGLQSLQGLAGNERYQPAFLQPHPRIALGRALRGLASAVIDISDGLGMDCKRLADASGVAIDIDPERLAGVAAAGDVANALSGGDDYELAFTVPAAQRSKLPAQFAAVEIGEVCHGRGVNMPGFDDPGLSGYDHFRNEDT